MVRSTVHLTSDVLTQADLEQLQARGIGRAAVEDQLARYARPQTHTRLLRPCTVGDGLTELSAAEVEALASSFEGRATGLTLEKFVPASGAASRMFGAALAWRGRAADRGQLERAAGSGDARAGELLRMVDGLGRLAFARELTAVGDDTGAGSAAPGRGDGIDELLERLLAPEGLGLASVPKALVPFHSYPEGVRTPVEEHLVEAAAYVCGRGGVARVHFTVPAGTEPRFDELLERVVASHERRGGVSYEVELSVQSPATDTLAVDAEGRPFRATDGSLLFRPGGHGALLGNLGRLEADLVFIKNIDNCVHDHLKPLTYLWKKALGGLALELQASVFAHLERLEQHEPARASIAEGLDFLSREFDLPLPSGLRERPIGEQREFALAALARPLRVCGMVRKVEAPGGGPFWVTEETGTSRQIVEIAQVDARSQEQQDILGSATHFNPVDLVCALRDRHGRPYELGDHVDHSAAFVVERSSGGRRLRSLELPGLWNGSMARWLSVFVEVPRETFNPVKAATDLLGPAHQPA